MARRQARVGPLIGSLPFWILDVFTDRRFAGNPLAVVGETVGLDDARMQAIAAEFNLSETVFLVEEDPLAGRAKIRIFTPRAELPFAGHPIIGTAFLLARRGFGRRDLDRLALVLEMPAGRVPVEIAIDGAMPVRARFTAPGVPHLGETMEPGLALPVLGLELGDLAADPPRFAGHGLSFLMMELASIDALTRSQAPVSAEALSKIGIDTGIFAFAFAQDGTIRARMFGAALGIVEDPATGSAAAALAVLLADRDPSVDASLAWRIEQGVEMGRPSTIEITATKRDGRVIDVTVGGRAVPVASGRIDVQP